MSYIADSVHFSPKFPGLEHLYYYYHSNHLDIFTTILLQTCCSLPPSPFAPRDGITDTESYRDLQQSYRAYNFVTELEIRTVQVLSRPYNQGTYGCCAGMARRPLTA